MCKYSHYVILTFEFNDQVQKKTTIWCKDSYIFNLLRLHSVKLEESELKNIYHLLSYVIFF